jgi:hypothetical protein
LFQIEEQLPTLRRFRNSWATAHLVKDIVTGRRTYASAKTKENSYRMRRRQKRLSQNRDVAVLMDLEASQMDNIEPETNADSLGDDDIDIEDNNDDECLTPIEDDEDNQDISIADSDHDILED